MYDIKDHLIYSPPYTFPGTHTQYLPVPYVQVYCCSIALAQSLSERDDASERVGDHECSAIFSWQALPGRVSSAPALHSSPCLHL